MPPPLGLHCSMNRFDYIIAGAGAAGLSLAWYLSQSKILGDKTVLLIDQDSKTKNDRTWCFWTEPDQEIFPDIIYRSWDRIQFLSPEKQMDLPLHSYRYQLIRGIDFYQKVKNELSKDDRFVFKKGVIDEISSDEEGGKVKVEGSLYSSQYVFSSLFQMPDHKVLKGHVYLQQHFIGQVVKADSDIFDSRLPVFMDFRVEQLGHPTFMYLLPYSGKEALVEYTLFSPELLKQESYYSSIAEYLEKYYNLKNYEVTHEERGAIPMTDYAFPSGDGQSVIYLGSAAGMSKASTGYTFYRIQKHSRQIIKQLERRQSPALAQQQSTWKLKMDRLMLHLMLTDGSNTWKIFQEMFENNPVGRVLSFLNEETSYMEDFLIMNSVPSGPFIKALMETGLKLN